jgi:hypothetical protein
MPYTTVGDICNHCDPQNLGRPPGGPHNYLVHRAPAHVDDKLTAHVLKQYMLYTMVGNVRDYCDPPELHTPARCCLRETGCSFSWEIDSRFSWSRDQETTHFPGASAEGGWPGPARCLLARRESNLVLPDVCWDGKEAESHGRKVSEVWDVVDPGVRLMRVE